MTLIGPDADAELESVGYKATKTLFVLCRCGRSLTLSGRRHQRNGLGWKCGLPSGFAAIAVVLLSDCSCLITPEPLLEPEGDLNVVEGRLSVLSRGGRSNLEVKFKWSSPAVYVEVHAVSVAG